MAAVTAASAELLIIGWYIFRVLLQVSICPGFGWERAPEEHPDPKCHSGTICPRPFACVPISSHRPCPQCAPTRPGTKTQGFGGRPAADDHNQCGVQVLPAEAGTHSVPDRTAGAGRAQAASPQLRLQIPALGGHVIRCSYASRPAWEPVPRSNGGGVPRAPSSEEHLPRSVRGQ